MTVALILVGVALYLVGFVATARHVAWERHRADGWIDTRDKLEALACGLGFPLYWLTLGIFAGIR